MDESTKSRPAPRLQLAERHQIVFRAASLDLLVSQDHPVRAVWEYVEQADPTTLYEAIHAVEGAPGRPPIDPKILLRSGSARRSTEEAALASWTDSRGNTRSTSGSAGTFR